MTETNSNVHITTSSIGSSGTITSASGIYIGGTHAGTAIGTSPEWKWYSIPDSKENLLDKFAFVVESEERMSMLLEKVSTGKLTPKEALDILKADRAVKIG